MLSNDMSRTRTVDKAAIIAGLNDDTVVMSKEDLHAAAAPVYEQESVPEPEPVYEAPGYDAPLQNQDDAFFDSLDAAGDVSNVPEGSVFDAEAMPQAQPIDFREENFEDLPDMDVPGTTFTSVAGNVGLTTAEPLKNVINKAYLEGFLNATYKEVTSYDANSPANNFRRAMGMNQTGKIQSSVTMWANRYPLEDTLKLFGAIPGFGAQLPQK